MLQAIDNFSLRLHPDQQRPDDRRLYFRDHDTGTSIPGVTIEAQYTWQHAYILITSQNCPFEESNDMLLLGPNFKLIAHTQLQSAYQSYLLDHHWPIAANTLRLEYHPQQVYTLTIHTQSGLFGNTLSLQLTRLADPAT